VRSRERGRQAAVATGGSTTMTGVVVETWWPVREPKPTSPNLETQTHLYPEPRAREGGDGDDVEGGSDE